MIIVGEHPAPLTLNLTAGQSETIALARVDVAGEPAGWAGAVTLETGLAGVDAITSAVAGDLATFVVPVDLVDQLYAARLTPGATRVRLLEDGRVVAAGMISWLADSGWTGATQQVQRYTVVVVAGGGGGGAGVTDHGALTGLMDDDHPQYLTAARGDARYVTPAGQAAAISAGDSATLSSAQTYALGLVDALTAASPSTLDTLAEIAAALGQDPTFAATITAALGKRVRVDAIQNFSVGEQAQARANIGATAAVLLQRWPVRRRAPDRWLPGRRLGRCHAGSISGCAVRDDAGPDHNRGRGQGTRADSSPSDGGCAGNSCRGQACCPCV